MPSIPLARRMTLMAVMLASLPTAAVQAQSAVDTFDYALGSPLASQGGGTGWATPWDGDAATVVTAVPTDPKRKLPSGGHGVGVQAATGQYLTANRGTAFTFGLPGTTEWFSFTIVRVFSAGAGTPPPYGGLALGRRRGLTVGDLGDGRWGMDTSGPPALDHVVDVGRVSDNIPVFLVLRADFRDDGDKFTLYQNPTPGLKAPNVPGVIKTDLTLDPTNTVEIVYGNGNAYVLGALRLGKTYAAVAPTATPPLPDPSPGADGGAAPDIKPILQAAYDARSEAMGRRDPDAVIASQSATFALVDAAGKPHPQTRQDLATLFRANARVQESVTLDAVSLDDAGDGATASAHDRLIILPKSGPGVQTDTTVRDFWVRKDGAWHLARRRVLTTHRNQVTRLPALPTPVPATGGHP